MTQDPLPPIPTPPSLRWREFRIRFLPVLLFGFAVGGVCLIWQNNVSAPMFVGAVEASTAQVATPYAGKIVELKVGRFQTVKKGDAVAVLAPTDPRVALAVIQSELDIIKTKLGPNQTDQRIKTDYQKLRTDWLVQKVDLATARVNLQGARDEMRRQESLHKQQLVSDDIYEAAVTLAGAFAAEVNERSNVVLDAESGLKQLEAMGLSNQTNNFSDALAAALEIEELKLKQAAASTEPVTLIAPIDGVVSQIYRQVGENIPDGDPVLVIAASKPERIVAYLRQPVAFEPKVGATVQVRTRAVQRQTSLAHINSIGAQFEPITNVLALIRPGMPADYGLPIEISLPPGLKVLPGEVVDLAVVAED